MAQKEKPRKKDRRQVDDRELSEKPKDPPDEEIVQLGRPLAGLPGR